jgi:protein-S-isoprenylcysteine O-methyltransferase Ste14
MLKILKSNKIKLDLTVDINHTNIKKAGQVVLYLFIFAGFVPFLLFFISLSLDRVLFAPSFMKEPVFLFLGLVFVVMGSTAAPWSIYLLRRRGKGYPLSPLPPVNLVVSGIYKFSRHPLYAGASLIF